MNRLVLWAQTYNRVVSLNSRDGFALF